MKGMDPIAAEVRQAEATEEQLIERAKSIASMDEGCKWEFGKVASEFHQRYSREHADQRLGDEVGWSQQTVQFRRAAWERFSEIYSTWSRLSWAHFKTAVDWNDAEEWLEKANENKWSVSRMKEERGGDSPHVTHNSGNNEWYTPAKWVESARAALGEIDLDPASNEVAQETVGAGDFYAAEDDGLSQDWRGRVFLNPPYERGLIDSFVTKLVTEFDAGNVTSAVLLVNNATEVEWFQKGAASCTAICFPAGRIKYNTPEGVEKGSPLQGQAFFYFGEDADTFAKHFSGHGIVLLRPWSRK